MYHSNARPRIQNRNWFEPCSNNNFAFGHRHSSSLLVIVLYLLKNNITFMDVVCKPVLPSGGAEADVIAKSSVSPPKGRWKV